MFGRVDVSIQSGADQVEPIHPSVVNGLNRTIPTVAQVALISILHGCERHVLPRGCDSAAYTVRSGERAEEIVKRVILFKNENRVLDGVRASYRTSRQARNKNKK